MNSNNQHDAWLNVDFFNQAGDWLTYYKEIEPVILVGISFIATEHDWIELRKEDFLPPHTDTTKVSRSKNFLNFIRKELIPYVEEHYSADPSDRGLFGSSFGGLFATWVLKEDPKLFKRISISSPSLWYDDFKLLKDPKLAENIANLNNKKIFVQYGSSESEKQKSGAESLFQLLNTNKNIQLKKFVLDGGHYSAYPETIIKTLTYLYAR
jgi:predicted alpha/beta superfamily hydrolase